jgi:hypothetical protein
VPDAGDDFGPAFLDVIFEPIERAAGVTVVDDDWVTAGLAGGTADGVETAAAGDGASGSAAEDNRSNSGALWRRVSWSWCRR